MGNVNVLNFLYCIGSLIIDCDKQELKKRFSKEMLVYFLGCLEYLRVSNQLLLFFVPGVKEKLYYLLNEFRFENFQDFQIVEEINQLIIDLNNIDDAAFLTLERPSFFDYLPNVKKRKANFDDYSYLGHFLYLEANKRDLFTLLKSNLYLYKENSDFINIGKVSFLGFDYTLIAQSIITSIYFDQKYFANIVLGDEEELRLDTVFLYSLNALLVDYPFLFANNDKFFDTIFNVINYSLDNLKDIPNKENRKVYEKTAHNTLKKIETIFYD